MKKLLASLVLASTLVCGLALAQPHRVSNIHPVPAPSLSIAHEEGGKEVPETEEEGPPGKINWWDSKILNNPHVPYGAMALNFVLLLLVYYRLFGKMTVQALKDRKTSIANEIEKAQTILKEAKQRSKRYRSKLEKIDAEAERAKQTQVETGKGEAELIMRAADEKASRLARDVEFLLEQEKKQTQIDLVRETVEKAAKEAEDLLRTNVSPADQERLADEFLTKLAADYAKGLPSGGAT